MVSILMDSVTGDPYLDEKNNVVEVDNERGFWQIIDGLFHCDVGSEPFNPLYGFDLRTALREASHENIELFIESLVAQALSSQIEKLISKVDYISAERDGTTMNVDIQVTSILSDSVSIDFGIGE